MEEINKILSIVKRPHHKFAIKLGALQGMRISEIINLQIKDVDFGRKTIHIREGKGGKDRYIPIAPPLKKKDFDLLPFKIGVRALQKAFKNYAIKSGIQKDVHFHTLRHSAITHWLDSGVDLHTIQQWAGHSSLSITQIYLHLSPKKSIELMEGVWK